MKNAKATITVKIPKPRSTVHEILASKRGGSHRKSDKALRSKAKNDLKKILGAGGDVGSYFFASPKACGAPPSPSRLRFEPSKKQCSLNLSIA